MSLKAYDLVASSKGELERTRRYSAFARKCSVGGDGSGCGGGGGGVSGGVVVVVVAGSGAGGGSGGGDVRAGDGAASRSALPLLRIPPSSRRAPKVRCVRLLSLSSSSRTCRRSNPPTGKVT